MSRFILVTKETYPILLQGFLNGADILSAANPENNGRDLRPGKTGGEIARSERAINRALLALSHEREFTDGELFMYGEAFAKEKNANPTLADIEKLKKPLELNENPCWLELNENDWERLVLYYSNAKWLVRASELAADILDLLEIAPKEKPELETKDGINA